MTRTSTKECNILYCIFISLSRTREKEVQRVETWNAGVIMSLRALPLAFEDNSLLGPPRGRYLLSYRNPFSVKGPSSPTYSSVTPLTAFEPKAKPQLWETPRSCGASRKNVISLSPQRLPLLASCKRQPPRAPSTQRCSEAGPAGGSSFTGPRGRPFARLPSPRLAPEPRTAAAAPPAASQRCSIAPWRWVRERGAPGTPCSGRVAQVVGPVRLPPDETSPCRPSWSGCWGSWGLPLSSRSSPCPWLCSPAVSPPPGWDEGREGSPKLPGLGLCRPWGGSAPARGWASRLEFCWKFVLVRW